MSASVSVTDFAGLQRAAKPNQWLVAPESLCPGAPDEVARTYAVAASVLARAWLDVLEHQPRTVILALVDGGFGIEAVQRSRVFRFPDRISVRVQPQGEERSTFAAYSRAELGYYDFGVNRGRLRAWIAAVEAKLAAG